MKHLMFDNYMYIICIIVYNNVISNCIQVQCLCLYAKLVYKISLRKSSSFVVGYVTDRLFHFICNPLIVTVILTVPSAYLLLWISRLLLKGNNVNFNLKCRSKWK